MREIKFRAWNKEGGWDEKGKMIYGDKDIDYNRGYSLSFDGIVHANWHSPGAGNVGHINCHMAKYDFKLTQYTGLKDKNGKEIYEGDFVRINDEDNNNCSHVEDITNIGWLRGFIDRKRPVEIIGNIYENPDLLKGDS